eukprot:660559-Pyramimonas_sp.AAC.1
MTHASLLADIRKQSTHTCMQGDVNVAGNGRAAHDSDWLMAVPLLLFVVSSLLLGRANAVALGGSSVLAQ